MSKLNEIQRAITELEGGAYQKLLDAYLIQKLDLPNLQSLGVQSGTNKTTKGIPDSYSTGSDGKLTLIMYGTVAKRPLAKIIKDLDDSYYKALAIVDKSKIKLIVVCFTSTDIWPEDDQNIRNHITGIEILPIGLSTLSLDLYTDYHEIARDMLQVNFPTRQLVEIDEFIEHQAKLPFNPSLNQKLMGRGNQLESIVNEIIQNQLVIVSGKPGVGKTKISLEALRKIVSSDSNNRALCLLDKGQPINADLFDNLEIGYKYFILIDDANLVVNLRAVVTCFLNPPKKVTLHIVFTIRDFKKDELLLKLEPPSTLPQINLEPLDDESIFEILRNQFGITNILLFNNINRVAKGNPRIAVGLGDQIIHGHLDPMASILQIFESYYKKLITKELNREERFVLFIICFFNKLYVQDNLPVNNILRSRSIDSSKFIEICNKLDTLEIIDLLFNKVIRVNDQNLADYVLFYCYFQERIVTLQELVHYLFTSSPEKIVDFVTTLLGIFPSEELTEAIQNEIKDIWKNGESSNQLSFASSFSVLIGSEVLHLALEKIQELPEDLNQISTINFEQNYSYRNEIMGLLLHWKRTPYMKDAFSAIVEFYLKKPLLAKSILEDIRLFYGFDDESRISEYKKELDILVYFSELEEEKYNNNLTWLFLYFLKDNLRLEIENLIPSFDDKRFTFVTENLRPFDSLIQLRRKAWQQLIRVSNNRFFKTWIISLIKNHKQYFRNPEKRLLKEDVKILIDVIVERGDPLLNEPNIVEYLYDQCQDLELPLPKVLLDKKMKNSTSLFANVVTLSASGTNWEEQLKKVELLISDLALNSTPEDFRETFSRLSEHTKYGTHSDWEIGRNIRCIFSSLEGYIDKFESCLMAYLQANAPYSFFGQEDIIRFDSVLSKDKFSKLIDSVKFDLKDRWKIFTLLNLPFDEITPDNTAEVFHLITIEINKDQWFIPSIYQLKEYLLKSQDLVYSLTEKILSQSSKNKKRSCLVIAFLGDFLDEKRIKSIEEIYQQEMSLLTTLFLETSDGNWDHSGLLVHSLITIDKSFLEKYLNHLQGSSYLYRAASLSKLWTFNDYEITVEQVIRSVITNKELSDYKKCEVYKDLFLPVSNPDYKDRVLSFAYKVISNNDITEIERINVANGVLHNLTGNTKLSFIEDLIRVNPDFCFFNNLHILPGERSWTGSELPLIDEDIDNIKSLISSLNSSKFLKHKTKLEEMLTYLKKKHKQVQVFDFLHF